VRTQARYRQDGQVANPNNAPDSANVERKTPDAQAIVDLSLTQAMRPIEAQPECVAEDTWVGSTPEMINASRAARAIPAASLRPSDFKWLLSV
jgi:hypothetical protein